MRLALRFPDFRVGKRAAVTLAGSLVLLLCSLSTQADQKEEDIPFASGAVPITDQNRNREADDAKFAECGVGCKYLKANENLTNQTEFIVRKSTFLMNLLKESDEAGAAGALEKQEEIDESIKSLLGAFCLGEEEEAATCANRYLNLNRFWLAKAGISIGKNAESSVTLKCAKYDSKGKCLEASAAPSISKTVTEGESKQPRRVQGAYVSTYSELAAQASQRLQSQSQEQKKLSQARDSLGWMEEFEPKEDDYIKFVSIPRDPSDPSLGTLEVPLKNGKDYVKDKVAFANAKKAWTAFTQLPDSRQALKDMKKQLLDKGAATKVLEKFAKSSSKKGKGQVEDAGSKMNREIYNTARASYVDQINAQLGQAKKGKAKPTKKNTAGQDSSTNSLKPVSGDEKIDYPVLKPGGGQSSEVHLTESLDTFRRSTHEKAGKNPRSAQQPNDPGRIPGSQANPAASGNSQKPPPPNPQDLEIDEFKDLFF